jgi:multiple sugar transport system ATP-binding protein
VATVVLRNVTKRFADITAVDDLSLEVLDGEFLVLLGPSGCGKTTALAIIAGLEQATAGDVYIGGELVNDARPKERDIAMVFQSYALYPHMSVKDNLAFGLRMRGLPRSEIDRKVGGAARMLALEDVLGRKPRQLSGGQRQRVALGRAVVREPQVFLMDEPLSNLDAQLRVATRAELIGLHRDLGITTIYVTHDQVEAMTMGSRIAILRSGRLQQLGTPQEVYESPGNKFVAEFIGSPAMNLFPAITEVWDRGVHVRGASFRLRLVGEQAEAVSKRRIERVVIGIRPEDVSPVLNDSVRLDERISARVDVVEPLGNEQIVYFRSAGGGERIVIRTGPRVSLQPEQRIDLTFNVDHLHIFEEESGVRVA